jgi:mannose-6-phosphate isomerase-like protein (cupin superfamily)
MSRQPENLRSEGVFSSADFGSPFQWREFVRIHPRLGEVKGKVFIGSVVGLTGMEVSFGALAAGESVPFLHSHKQNEELYVVLSGAGELQVDGSIIPLQAGSAVRIAPEGVRCIRALGTEPMSYFVVQAKAGSLEQATGNDGIVPDRPVVW